MKTTGRPLRKPEPVRGVCRWVSRSHGVLEINSTRYTVVCLPTHFRLLNWQNGNAYSVNRDGGWCTCPSFVWDHCPIQAGGDGRCKHIAALRSLGLLPEQEKTAEKSHSRCA